MRTICKFILPFIFLFGFSSNGFAQLPVWVLGSSQQDATGNFNSNGPNHLKFYNVDFTGASPVSTPRTVGASINAIPTVGTQEVINNAVDANKIKEKNFFIWLILKMEI